MKKTKNAPDTPASSIANSIAAHPFVDAVASLVVSVSWYMSECRTFDFEEPCAELFTSLSSVSGLLMAAATFICSMVYQSGSGRMKYAITKYSDELSRNWSSIIVWTMVTAVLPLISLYIYKEYARVAIAVSLYSVLMMFFKTIRSMHWLKYTLFMQKTSQKLRGEFTDDDMKKAAARSDRF